MNGLREEAPEPDHDMCNFQFLLNHVDYNLVYTTCFFTCKYLPQMKICNLNQDLLVQNLLEFNIICIPFSVLCGGHLEGFFTMVCNASRKC